VSERDSPQRWPHATKADDRVVQSIRALAVRVKPTASLQGFARYARLLAPRVPDNATSDPADSVKLQRCRNKGLSWSQLYDAAG